MNSPVPFDKSFSQKVTEAVARIEERSDAEIVVVVARASGSYADVDLMFGLLLGMLALALVLYGPWIFRPDFLLLEVALIVLAGRWLSRRSSGIRRLLTSSARRRKQVEAGAKIAFLDHAVHATRGRTGVLLYLSQLERLGCVLTDHGIDGRVPRSVWTELKLGLERGGALEALEEALHDGLELLAQRLPEHLPSTGENPDEIPNAPRMLP